MPRLHRAGIRTGATAAFLAALLRPGRRVLAHRRRPRRPAPAAAMPGTAPAGCTARPALAARPPVGPAPAPRADPGARRPAAPLEIEPDRSRVTSASRRVHRLRQGTAKRSPAPSPPASRSRPPTTRGSSTAATGRSRSPRASRPRRTSTGTTSPPPSCPPRRMSWSSASASAARSSRRSTRQPAPVPSPADLAAASRNLAAFLLLQEMMRGSLIFNLDPKWISHLWLQDLPNVINAHDIPDLHVALCWLAEGAAAPHQGRLLLRRAAPAGSAATSAPGSSSSPRN